MAGGYVPKKLFDGAQATKLKPADSPKTKEASKEIKQPNFNQFGKKPAVVSEDKILKPSSRPLIAQNASKDTRITSTDRLLFKGFENDAIIRIKTIVDEIQMDDRQYVVTFGQEINKKLSASVDQVLEFIKDGAFTQQVSHEALKLTQLISTDFSKEPEAGFFGMFKQRKTLSERINEVLQTSEEITKAIDTKINSFVKLVPKLDQLLDDVIEYHLDLMIIVRAGKEAINEFCRFKREKLEKRLNGSNLIDGHNARDALDIFETFEKRVQSLELSLGQNEMTIAQIRLTQQTNVKMVETLNNAVSTLIPMWKRSLISAISTNNFDEVNKNKDLLFESMCNIIPQQNLNYQNKSIT